MTCFRPIIGYRSKTVNPTGKRSIVFNPHDGYVDMPVVLPCGSCIGCRLNRSQQWAVRCMHEASLYKENSFLTLTYNEESLPVNGSLVLRDVQNFIKRLRKRFPDNVIRYFLCGEYGDLHGRPHYHVLLFGFDFHDKRLPLSKDKVRMHSRHPVFVSDTLSSLWPFGISAIGDVTFESAAYVSRYIMKKIVGKKALEHYNGKMPEFCTMSLKPAIGSAWIEKYFTDVYPYDYVKLIDGRTFKPPKYYDKFCETYYPELFSVIKAHRKIQSSSADYVISSQKAILDYQRLEEKMVHKMKETEKLLRKLEV